MSVPTSKGRASSTAAQIAMAMGSATATTSAPMNPAWPISTAAQIVTAIPFPITRIVVPTNLGHRKMEDVRLMKGVEMEETGEMEEMEKNPSRQHRRGEEEVSH